MAKDDDILMGDPVALTTDRDSDGDGVGDMQERLEGTDPGDASDHLVRDPKLGPEAVDPRGDLDPASLEREVAFEPTALMPDGMSVDSGLAGLKNVDGSDLPTGTNRYGVGDDAILDGRLGANSPRDVQRDPLAGTGADSDSKGGTPPAGLGSRGPKWDLVADEADGEWELPVKPYETPKVISDPPAPPPDAERAPPPPPPDDGSDPLPDPEPGPVPIQTNPDADLGGSGATPLAVIAGPRVVDGAGGGPQIEGDAPPVPVDLLHDPGDEGGHTETSTEAPRGRPDDPVVHTINPNTGIVRPPPGGPPPGGGGGDDIGLFSGSDPATAASADGAGAPGISLAGSGGGGIASVAPDAGAAAVDAFATEYLEDASFDAAPDLARAGLAADLGGDPAAQVVEFESPMHDGPDTRAPDEFAGPGDDDGFDG